jgi:hypothetical protein
MTIAGQTYTVTQADGCTFTLSPPSPRMVPKTPLSYMVTIGASDQSCMRGASSVTSGGTWLSIVSGGGSGSGNGVLTFAVLANTGTQRSGTITITGQSYMVVQAAGP